MVCEFGCDTALIAFARANRCVSEFLLYLAQVDAAFQSVYGIAVPQSRDAERHMACRKDIGARIGRHAAASSTHGPCWMPNAAIRARIRANPVTSISMTPIVFWRRCVARRRVSGVRPALRNVGVDWFNSALMMPPSCWHHHTAWECGVDTKVNVRTSHCGCAFFVITAATVGYVNIQQPTRNPQPKIGRDQAVFRCLSAMRSGYCLGCWD